MLFVKILLPLAGGGAVVGVTYRQTQKDTSNENIVVSNNHESKVRAQLKNQIEINLLKHQKQLAEKTQTSNQLVFTGKETEFKLAEQNLKDVYDVLNLAKTKLNDVSKDLKQKYGDLQTKEASFIDTLKISMAHSLSEAVKAENTIFYNEQKNTYTKEKDAVVDKINKIYPTSTVVSSTVCSGSSVNWTPTLQTPATTKETNINKEITNELTAICKGLEENTAHISNNSADKGNTKAQNVASAKTEMEEIITKISELTKNYSSAIIEIKQKENESKMKLFHFHNQQEAYATSKKKTTRNKK